MFSLSEQATFSFRADCFLFSSRLLSLFEQTIFTLQHTKSLKKRLKNKQKPTTFLQVKSTTFPTSKLTTIQQAKLTTFLQAKPTTFLQAKSTTILQAKPTTFLQAKAHNLPTSKAHSHNHIPIAQKNTQKTSKSSKISPIFYPLTYF